MKKIIFCLLCLSATSTSWSDPIYNLELLMGGSSQKARTDNYSVSGDTTSWGIRASADVLKYITAEISYEDFGEIDDERIDSFGDTINDKIDTIAGSIGIKSTYSPLKNNFFIYGRLGLSSWETTYEATDSGFPGQTFKSGDDGIDLYYSIGFQHYITKSIHTGLEYHVLSMNPKVDSTTIDHTIRRVALTVGYHF